MYKSVYVDQCGYLPSGMKRVTIKSRKPMKFTVFKTDGTPVFEGMADRKVKNASAGEVDYIGDFSSLTEAGRYYVVAENFSESDSFVIGQEAYDDVFQKAMDFFYLQRCGQDLDKKAAGDFAHCACHTGKAIVYGNEEKTVDVTGGWHDAGDYGRYVAPGAMTVAQLLLAWERNPKLCKSYVCPDESQKGEMPSFLAELKYELDWMCKMQREDGALYHKATCYQFCGYIMPQYEKETMVISPVSVTATGDFAAVAAMAAKFYEPYDSAYAKMLVDASKKAYAAMKTMELPGGFKNPKEIKTGEYDDANDLDERYWAAAQLYKEFGDAEYKEDFENLAKTAIYQGYGWRDMGTYGNLAYLSTDRPVNKILKKKIEKAMIKTAKERLAVVNKDGYGTSLKKTEYIWGCNMDTANHGLSLYDGYKLTGEKKYLDAAMEQIHYLLGRNPMGLCYLTGCGTNPIKHPHHRPSAFLGKAMPGMLSGGPCDWMADEVVKGMLDPKTPPAKMIVDMTGSYSTNEVTIYWNSAFLALLASVMQEMS